MRRIIEERFGKDYAADKRWMICGDFNDYRQRIVIGGDTLAGFTFAPTDEPVSCLDVLLADGFAVNAVERRDVLDRWTLYHTRGPLERHLCQLDYILLSPALARRNEKAVPDIIRRGQPWRTIFPPGPGGRALSARRLGPAESVGPLPGRRHARHRLKAPWISTFPAASSCRSARSTLRSTRRRIRSRRTIWLTIDANWLDEKAANPALFDGEVSLLARLAYRDRAA